MNRRDATPEQHCTVVLVGAGHAHLVLLCSDLGKLIPYAKVAVLAPRFFVYSSLISSYLAEDLDLEACSIDIKALCLRLGVTFIEGTATAIDLAKRRVTHTAGVLRYDVCSVAIGSSQRPLDDSFTVKTYEALERFRSNLEPLKIGASYTIEVIGGGPTGCEVAYALQRLSVKRHLNLHIRLVCQLPLLARWHPHLQKSAELTLKSAKIELSNVSQGCELKINCTGIVPNVISGLPIGSGNAVQVHNTLAVTDSNHTCFAAGDCVDFFEYSLERLGVYPVRQAPILKTNLYKSLSGDSDLREYRPQLTVLQILNLHRSSVLQWGVPGARALVLKGWFPQRLKKYLDARYMSWIKSHLA